MHLLYTQLCLVICDLLQERMPFFVADIVLKFCKLQFSTKYNNEISLAKNLFQKED